MKNLLYKKKINKQNYPFFPPLWKCLPEDKYFNDSHLRVPKKL